MTKKLQVLLAHEDMELVPVLQLMLEEHFELDFVGNIEDAQQAVSATCFDFVLLGTELAGKPSLSICKLIADTYPEQHIPVIVLSELNDEGTIKSAYEQGAFDYVCIPFNVVAFYEHLLRFAEDLKRNKQQENQDKAFMSVAETAMKQASFYGQGLEVLSSLNFCQSVQQVTEAIGKSMTFLGVNCAVQCRTTDQILTLHADGSPCNEIEEQIFALLKDQGRIYHFGRRAIFNAPGVSVLVKSMPLEGSAAHDAALDMLAKLVPAVDARLVALQQQKMLLDAQSALLGMMSMAEQTLQQIEQEKLDVLDSVTSAVGVSFHELDLQEHQERFFLRLIEHELRDKLQSAHVQQLQDLIANCLSSLRVEAPQASDEQAIQANTQDIELF